MVTKVEYSGDGENKQHPSLTILTNFSGKCLRVRISSWQCLLGSNISRFTVLTTPHAIKSFSFSQPINSQLSPIKKKLILVDFIDLLSICWFTGQVIRVLKIYVQGLIFSKEEKIEKKACYNCKSERLTILEK